MTRNVEEERRNLPHSISSHFHVLDWFHRHLRFRLLVLLLFIHRRVFLVVIASRNFIDIPRMAGELQRFLLWVWLHRHNTDKHHEVANWDLVRVAPDVINVPRRVGELRKGEKGEKDRGRHNGDRTDLGISELLNRDVELGGVLSPVPPPGNPVPFAPIMGSQVFACAASRGRFL
jgi:hypothetical protein